MRQKFLLTQKFPLHWCVFYLAMALCARPTHAQDLLQQFPVRASKAKPAQSQSKIARKGAFPSISGAQLSGAFKATDLAKARELIGKNARFVGVVTQIFTPKSGSIVLLNFARDYKTALVGAVKARDFARFPDLQTLRGQKVVLRGVVVSYRGRPEIELRAVGDIQVVKVSRHMNQRIKS